MDQLTEEVEDIELLPSERNEVILVWSALQRKYGGREDSSLTLMEFCQEGTTRFKELGFVVHIDPTTLDVTESGEVVSSPTVTFLRRIVPEVEHDHGKHSFEVKSGFSDGIEGEIGEHGEFKDQKKFL